ncbi:MAG: hypothetical protein IKJ74_03410 [Clostridia bacterium]|nr:hypothetical protein [Clostridia bacterium]
MFQLGETVRYGIAGLCCVQEICAMKVGGQSQEYYVLKPLLKAGSLVYVPVANEALVAKMLPPLTALEAEEALEAVSKMEPEWIRDFRKRSEFSKKALNSGDPRAVLFLMKNICFHKSTALGDGKRIHTTDDYFLKDAENLIFTEFSHVLEKDTAETAAYVRERLGLL